MQVAWESGENGTISKASQKNFKRNFKKGIDKWKEMWYNRQAVHERQRRSLKIEQQEISTKQKQVRNTNLVDRVYILKK